MQDPWLIQEISGQRIFPSEEDDSYIFLEMDNRDILRNLSHPEMYGETYLFRNLLSELDALRLITLLDYLNSIVFDWINFFIETLPSAGRSALNSAVWRLSSGQPLRLRGQFIVWCLEDMSKLNAFEETIKASVRTEGAVIMASDDIGDIFLPICSLANRLHLAVYYEACFGQNFTLESLINVSCRKQDESCNPMTI